jgi:hypothetical protein
MVMLLTLAFLTVEYMRCDSATDVTNYHRAVERAMVVLADEATS